MSITKATLRAALVAATLLPAGARAADLAADVAAKLRESGSLQGYRVNVKAKSGTVWLEGRVADQQQLAAAVGIAESSPGVERVVNRLTVESQAAGGGGFGLPASMRAYAAPARPDAPQLSRPAARPAQRPGPAPSGPAASGGPIRLAQAVAPNPAPQGGPQPTALRPLLFPQSRQPASRAAGGLQPAAYNRMAMQGGPMTLPAPGGMGEVVGERIVPGSERYSDGSPAGTEMIGGPGGPEAYAGGYAGGGMPGGPMAMGGTGVGMPPIPMRGDGPNMPNYAWPSYAAHPNYAALQYPTQYSPTAWPYIGPFYPYPQVPLGWRRVSLEWDDGWWWLDFDERHIHNHHR